MQPEVLAWALLFVVGFGIVYRFFAWAGRRLSRTPPLAPIAQDTAIPGEASEDAPAPSQASEPAEGRVVAAERSRAPPISEVTPQSLYAPLVLSGEKIPKPAPASDYATAEPANADPSLGAAVATATVVPGQAIAPPSMPVASSAVMAARIAAAAVRTALAPSVAATLPPFRQPSVDATLPPQPIASPSPEPSPVVVSSAPQETPPPDVVAAPTIAESSEDTVEPSRTREDGSARKSIFLRAWRLGAEAPSLDIRLKDARDRKTVQMPKMVRGPSEPHGAKELKVLAPKAAPEKMPARRIGQKAGDDGVLTSAKAQTRIVGAPHRASRVLSAPCL